MTQPWKKSEETTRAPATLREMNYSQPQKKMVASLNINHVSWLWVELTKIYGALFLTKFGTKDNGTWFDALKGLTPKALESGMDRLRDLAGNGKFAEYPPNSLQFKALCMAFYNDLELPKPSVAYMEIKNSAYKTMPAWSHPLIAFIAKKLPDNFFKLDQESVAYGLFKELYEQASELVKQGHEIPKIQVQQRTRPTRNPEVARAYLNQMKQHIGA